MFIQRQIADESHVGGPQHKVRGIRARDRVHQDPQPVESVHSNTRETPVELLVKPPCPKTLVAAYNIFAEKLGSSRIELPNLPELPELKVHGDPKA
ncbi:MAG: hypothetical protein QXF10_03560 [Ignisphaera sp.]